MIHVAPTMKNSNINPKRTGLFSPGAALEGEGMFSTPSVKLDPDILESLKLQG